MDEHRQGVATNGARAESRSEQGWGKDRTRHRRLQRPHSRGWGMSDKIKMSVIQPGDMPTETQDVLRLWFTRPDGSTLANMAVMVRTVLNPDASEEECNRLGSIIEMIHSVLCNSIAVLHDETSKTTEKCAVCGAVNDADKEHNCGATGQTAEQPEVAP